MPILYETIFFFITAPPRAPQNPCDPSPCGPNSNCRQLNEQAVCSCRENYIGSPPQCRPECIVNSECGADRACVNQKCADPCPNTCGLGAVCNVRNHNPICACRAGFTGDPFIRCSQIIEPPPVITERPPSCIPSPCGPNSQCQMIGGVPACSCLDSYLGTPPTCRPECSLSSECSSQLSCVNNKCKDPCPGSCGYNANCYVLNHLPICSCNDGFTGDPFTQCSATPPSTEASNIDPCDPSPCGSNAVCRGNGECTCLPEYSGNPYEMCRPECVTNQECSRDQACMRNKCRDPCPGTCGQNAECDVINHIPICSCPTGYEGDPFTACRIIDRIPDSKRDPCNPTPCGPNSLCRDIDEHAVCSCIQGFIGTPPSCKPECVVSSECLPTQACINQKCTDPCLGSCGFNARCEVINHSPICSCREGQTGDPFQRCYNAPPPTPPPIDETRDPCAVSPCGPNSLCRPTGPNPSCTCLDGYVGQPPNCRPECVINTDCPSTHACINSKCRDPCPGSCGANAECRIISHTVSCTCVNGYTGDPFTQCTLTPREYKVPYEHHYEVILIYFSILL